MPTPTSFRNAARLALAVALLATAAVDASAQRYPREPVCGRNQAAAFPGSASYDAGLDTLAAVLQVVARGAVQQPGGVFLLTTDHTGARPKAQVLASNLPETVYPRLREAAAAYLGSHPQRERLFFWVDLGGGGALPGYQPVRFCLPHVRNRETIQGYMNEAARLEATYARMGDPGVEDSRSGSIDLLVDRSGTVLWLDVGRPSGSGPVDDYYLFIASQMKFTPGTIDGAPRVFRVQFDMTVMAY